MSYTKYLNWVALGLLALVPFVAFIVASNGVSLSFPFFGANLFFPYITGKNFMFRILVELLLLVYILLALREPKFRPKTSWLLWSVLAFVVWMGLSTAFSLDPVKSFWSNFERMEGYITVLHLFVLFVVSGAVLTANRWWERFFQISIFASVLMGLIAVAQLFDSSLISSQSGLRLDTTFGNATYLAVYMLIHIFLTLFMLARSHKSQAAWWLYSTALALQFVGLFFTETRGAALGLLGGLIIAALYMVWRGRGGEWRLLRRVALGGLAGIVVLTGLFFALRDTAAVQNTPMLSRLASISLDDPTTMSRFLHIWPMAVKGGLERPVLGWGQENFSYVFNANYAPEMYEQEQWFDRAHNQFLDWLVAGGVPAFLLYVSFFLLAAWAVFRSTLSVPEQAAFLGLLAAYAFNNLFVFDNLVSVMYFYLLLAFVHSISQRELPQRMFLLKPVGDKTVAIVAPVIAVILLGGAWFLNSGGLVSAQTLIHAITSTTQTGEQKDIAENLAAFEKALSQNGVGQQEIVEQLLQFVSNRVAPGTALSPEVRQQAYTLARTSGEALLARRQNDARLELFMGVFHNQFGEVGEAQRYFELAQEHSPDKQQVLFQVGLSYLQQNNAVSAIAIFKQAFDLAPEFRDARIFYAIGLYFAGQNAQADALLEEGFGTVLVEDERLMQAYVSTGQHQRLIAIWMARLAREPENADFRLGLASAYFSAGDNAATIEQLREVIKLNPAAAAQMQALITQIENGTLQP